MKIVLSPLKDFTSTTTASSPVIFMDRINKFATTNISPLMLRENQPNGNQELEGAIITRPHYKKRPDKYVVFSYYYSIKHHNQYKHDPIVIDIETLNIYFVRSDKFLEYNNIPRHNCVWSYQEFNEFVAMGQHYSEPGHWFSDESLLPKLYLNDQDTNTYLNNIRKIKN